MKKVFIGLIVIFLIIVGLFIWIKSKHKTKEEKVEITEITHLDFYYSTSTAMYGWVSYVINCEDKCILTIKPNDISEEEVQEVEIDKSTMNKVKKILNKYEVIKWDGFSKSDHNVLDGNNFHLYLTIQNNKNISASGYMMYPTNYRYVENELDELLGGFYKDGTN